MKWMTMLGITSLLLSQLAFATPPVTLSPAKPAIRPGYYAGSSTTVLYTLTNGVHKSLPIRVTGISNPITRTEVENDCGNRIPAASTCNLGITISPSFDQIGLSVNQMLQINYQGRESLTTPISFSVIQAQAYGYVTPVPGSHTMDQCGLDMNDGTFLFCTTAYINNPPQAYGKFTFATVSETQYAYVTDQTGFVYQCTINSYGGFDACSPTPSSTPDSWGPHDIAFATVNAVQYGYVTDINVGKIYQCFLNSAGNFTSCTAMPTNVSFSAPYAIDFAVVNGVQYAYIGDAGNAQVYQCTLNNDGTFNICSATPMENTNGWIPYGIDFATTNGVQYAYVADNGTSPTTGHIYKCTLNSNGTFNTCSTTPEENVPTDSWVPSDIAFATVNGTQYAYVPCYQANLGNLYRCDLTADGSLDACISTPVPMPFPNWTPFGIGFRFN